MEKLMFGDPAELSKPMTFLVACIHFFGLREGQKPMAFATQEVKKLTEKDREEIREGLVQNGYTIVASQV